MVCETCVSASSVDVDEELLSRLIKCADCDGYENVRAYTCRGLFRNDYKTKGGKNVSLEILKSGGARCTSKFLVNPLAVVTVGGIAFKGSVFSGTPT